MLTWSSPPPLCREPAPLAHRPLSAACAETRLRLARAGVTPLLLQAMQRYPEAESLHVYAVAALCRIAKVGGEYTARMATDGTVEALQRAGERFAESTVHHHVRLALARIQGAPLDPSP